MRNIIFVAMASVIAFGCGSTPGTPTEFANACNADNEKKTLEVSGVLQARTGIFCSNTSGRMECGFDFFDAVGSEKKFSAEIEQGSGANTVDKIEKGFKKEDIKVRDNAGNQIALGADKIKLTGKMSIVAPFQSSPGVCFMTVEKIEK